MEPIRMEGDVAVFSDQQLDIFGLPDREKYPRYMVIEGPPVYVQSFVELSHCEMRKRHRYDRAARFRSTVKSVFGYTRRTADDFPFLPLVIQYVADDEKRYENTRKILKAYGFAHMYKEIPTVLRLANKKPVVELDCPSEIVELLCDDFKFFQRKYWSCIDTFTKRRYMLNMKFLVVKFLERRGIELDMPRLRTTPKIKALTEVFDFVMSK
jgi:hypothetical protein